tara:strand:- start:115 stop:360 length:246 start_codon:yes stop_codon:yes gene_type:complete
MITAVDRKFSCIIREYPFFDIFHMGTIYTNWDIMFAFTCNGAGMAPDTQPVIYDKPVAHFMIGLVGASYTLGKYLLVFYHD